MTISGKAALAGVVGWPIAHSRSPKVHGFWLAEYKIDGAYVPLAVRPEDLSMALDALGRLGFRGVNVTVPHKEHALKRCAALDAPARRIGAVNTITFDGDGGLSGANTDGYGFLQNLTERAPNWRAEDGPAIVLGAGGAARAVVAALLDAGAPQVRIANRTAERAESLLRDMSDDRVEIVPWAKRNRALADVRLVVNATSLGMRGEPPLDLSLDALAPAAVVNDIVYTPLTTPLLSAATARGNTTVDGLGMLLHQARPGFAAWFGVDPKVTPALRQHILDDLTEPG